MTIESVSQVALLLERLAHHRVALEGLDLDESLLEQLALGLLSCRTCTSSSGVRMKSNPTASTVSLTAISSAGCFSAVNSRWCSSWMIEYGIRSA